MAFQLENIPKQKKSNSTKFDVNTLLKKEISIFGNSFSNKMKEAFYAELSVLLEAGLTLKDALTLIEGEQKKEHSKKMFASIIDQLILGKSLSEAVQAHKEFTEYEYYSIKIGEETGTLKKVSKELGLFFKRKNEQKRTILNALSYPIIVLLTAFFAIAFMLQFVVPMFASIFKQNKVALPWITEAIIKASNTFQTYYGMGIIILIFLGVLIRLNRQKSWYKKITTLAVSRIPFVGEYIRKVRIAQFTQAITLLTSAKVPLLEGIRLTKKMVAFYPLQKALAQVEEDILEGQSLHQSLSKHKVFDRKMVSLIKVAEQTNQNETIFQRLTQQYNEEISHQSKLISSTIEPFIILLLGGVVAIILIAMYLPMFKLSTVIS